MDDNMNIFSIDLKIDIKENFILNFLYAVKYHKYNSSKSAKKNEIF